MGNRKLAGPNNICNRNKRTVCFEGNIFRQGRLFFTVMQTEEVKELEE